jgi:hypothetical protein
VGIASGCFGEVLPMKHGHLNMRANEAMSVSFLELSVFYHL